MHRSNAAGGGDGVEGLQFSEGWDEHAAGVVARADNPSKGCPGRGARASAQTLQPKKLSADGVSGTGMLKQDAERGLWAAK